MMDLSIDGYSCTYDTSQEAARKTVEAIINWCNRYRCDSAETLCQDDDCMIESPYLVAYIIDNILKFDCKYEG